MNCARWGRASGGGRHSLWVVPRYVRRLVRNCREPVQQDGVEFCRAFLVEPVTGALPGNRMGSRVRETAALPPGNSSRVLAA